MPSALHVVNVLEEGAVGGPQRRSIAVAEELNSRPDLNIRTTLLFSNGAADLRQACEDSGIGYVQMPMDALSRRRQDATRYVATFVPQVAALVKYLRSSDVDAVHVSGGSFCFKGPIAARIAGVPYAWHLNDTKSHALVRRCFQLVAKIAPPAHLIFAADPVRNSYERWIPKNLAGSIVPAPHRRDLLDLSRSAFSDPYPAVEGCRILMLSNTNPVKGIDTAIQAMAETAESAHLFVAGGTKSTQIEYQDRLNELVTETGAPVTFIGHLTDVAPYLAHADMSLCSSRAEASPLSVWEAAAAGKPIVSTDVGDVARLLPNEKAALIVPPESSTDLARAIDRLASDAQLRASLGREAQQRMATTTSVDIIAKLSALAYRATAGLASTGDDNTGHRRQSSTA